VFLVQGSSQRGWVKEEEEEDEEEEEEEGGEEEGEEGGDEEEEDDVDGECACWYAVMRSTFNLGIFSE
jgi:hypothetical protein